MTDRVNELRQFVRQIEGVNADLKSLTADRAEIFKAAQQQGYNVAALRRVVAERTKTPAERQEAETIFRLYLESVEGGEGSAEPQPEMLAKSA